MYFVLSHAVYDIGWICRRQFGTADKEPDCPAQHPAYERDLLTNTSLDRARVARNEVRRLLYSNAARSIRRVEARRETYDRSRSRRAFDASAGGRSAEDEDRESGNDVERIAGRADFIVFEFDYGP